MPGSNEFSNQRRARSRYADIPTVATGANIAQTATGDVDGPISIGSVSDTVAAGSRRQRTVVAPSPITVVDATIEAEPVDAETVEAVSVDPAEEQRRRARARTAERTRTHRAQTASRNGKARRSAQSGSWFAEFAATYRKQLTVIGAVIVAFALIGIMDTAVNWGKVYTGVHVGAVDVSGMTVEEASAAIAGHYGNKLAATDVNIYADEATLEKARSGQKIEDLQESESVSAEEAAAKRKKWTVNAAEMQASISNEDLANEALQVGRDNGGLFARVSAQTFGWNVEPRLDMNETAIERLGRSIDRTIGNAHVDYGVEVYDGVAVVTDGHAGKEVDRDVLRANLSEQFLGEVEEDGFVAVAEDAPVRIDQSTAQAVADRINQGIGYGATFTFEGARWEASTYDLGMLIKTKVKKRSDGEGYELVASYDQSEAKSVILSNLQSTYSKQNVHVEFMKTDENIMVQTGTSGTMPEVGAALEKLESLTLDQVPTTTPEIAVEGTQIPPTMSIEAAMDYGLISTISSYETEYTGGATNRNSNIHLAADLLNNSIVKANGGQWSFNEVAGDCNAERGFKGAGTIVDGQVVDDVGGGICQVATTVFNAVFEAGLPVVERQNHSLYIASYPAGRDAAISWPDLDLVWSNDTNCDILVQTSWTDTTITVTLLGVDPGYSVEAVEGEFKDGAKHGVRTEESKDLARGEYQVKQAGVDGSSIDVVRIVRDVNNKIVRKDTFNSVYDAQDEIIEVGPNTNLDLSQFTSDDEDKADEDGDVEDEEESEDDMNSENEESEAESDEYYDSE